MFHITFQKSCDALVCGSTLYALDLAITSARAGRRVVLAMERTNPFIESIGALRPHVDASADVSRSGMLTEMLAENSISESEGRLYFNPHQVAKWIEDRLIESGVSFYYNAMPVSVLKGEKPVGGAVFGGKPGLFAIEAGKVFDCTLSSVIAKTAGVSLLDNNSGVMACYSMELNGEPEPGEYAVSRSGISGTIHVHRFFADLELKIDGPEKGPFGYAKDFVRVYDAALEALDTHKLSRF